MVTNLHLLFPPSAGSRLLATPSGKERGQPCGKVWEDSGDRQQGRGIAGRAAPAPGTCLAPYPCPYPKTWCSTFHREKDPGLSSPCSWAHRDVRDISVQQVFSFIYSFNKHFLDAYLLCASQGSRLKLPVDQR